MIPIYVAHSGHVEQLELVVKSDKEWQLLLSPQEYDVTRKKGTEPAFTGKYHDFKQPGLYQCICCGIDLFSSDAKFDFGTGWPSFSSPISDLNIKTKIDSSYGMIRTEVLCSVCEAHLGHVFDDGPPPTHKRYCMNSTSLKFIDREK